MEKKLVKILLVIIITVSLIMICENVFAAVSDFTGATSGFGGGDTKIKNVISAALAVVRTVGAGIAVLILMVLGCKYMLSAAGERAEIKKYAYHYVVGAVVLFASSAIISIIKEFVDGSMSS